MLHPDVPETLRGTYLGPVQRADHPAPARRWASRPSSCCPVHQEASEPRLAQLGLVNYWGYSPIGYFAPDVRFATAGLGGQVTEFKRMVREFHAAGLEVLLDVVYNHTAEGGATGPDARVPRHRQRRVLSAGSRAPGAVRGLHRLREHARPAGGARDWTWCSTACATGSRRCTSTGSGSTSRRCSGGWTRRSIRRAPFFERVRAGPRARGREADRRALGPGSRRVPGRALSRRDGRSGTASSATACGGSGAATPAAWASWPRAWPGAATSTRPGDAARSRASTSSPATTGSRCTTS